MALGIPPRKPDTHNASMPRFVLLRHECPSEFSKPSHWDFMLEQQGKLKTWELPALPKAWVEQLNLPEQSSLVCIEIQQLADHRIEYLEYQGPISGNRGRVKRIDSGSYEVQRSDENLLEIQLAGEKLNGIISLRQAQGKWHLLAKYN